MAAGQGQQAIDGVSRRRVLRGGLLAGAGVVTAGAMSAILTGTARAGTAEPQPGWRWCDYCMGLFWGPSSRQYCLGNRGPHVAGSGTIYDLYIGYGGQQYWRWCGNCALLFWADSSAANAQAGYCPSNYSHHVAGSGTNYCVAWAGTF
jgi:hypothetical protein